ALAADDGFVAALGGAAAPDLALGGVARLLEALPTDGRDRLVAALREDDALRERLLAVLGTSAALGDHLARHPDHWTVLADPSLLTTRLTAEALRAELVAAVGSVTAAQGADALRVAYRRRLLGLAARDMSGALTVE